MSSESILAALRRLLCMLLLCWAGPALGADWLIIQGTEVGQPEQALRPFGFAQVAIETVFGQPVEGLTAPMLVRFNGQRAVFNLVGGKDAPADIDLRRLRPAVRGSIPGTGQHMSYLLMVEMGHVGLTRAEPLVVTDASLTLSFIPGARLRLGQFKLPLADEALEMIPAVGEFINISTPTLQLVMESKVSRGAYVGGAYGFRDIGIQVFDGFQRGHLALSYAAMLSNGRMGNTDDDGNKDLSGRLMLSFVFSGQRHHRERQELSLLGWVLYGRRTLDDGEVGRLRAGVGAHLLRDPLHLRAEVIYARGALVLGQNPAFRDQPIAVSPDGQAIGWYAQASLRLWNVLRVGLRYDELYRQWDESAAARLFRTLTPAIEYDPWPQLRVMLNYERRWLSAPGASADATRIVDSIGDRLTLQLTALL